MERVEALMLVRSLLEQGVPASSIAAETGLPASTIGRWRRRGSFEFGAPPVRLPWRPPDAWSYAYLLGAYLGDGTVYVSKTGKCVLRICLDGAYPGIVEEVRDAIGLTTLGGRTQVLYTPGSRINTVQSAWKRWPEAFPQHGPGRKHERPIVLADWQQDIVDAQPRQFIRGLIHSDGCRTVNRFKTKLPSGRVAEYAYPRYFFSNLSPDIRRLFCEACEQLGVRWTLSNPRNVSVSHRDSVAILEEVVGPKA